MDAGQHQRGQEGPTLNGRLSLQDGAMRLTNMWGEVLFYHTFWAISSVGERFLHTEEVAGSIPASPTTKIKALFVKILI